MAVYRGSIVAVTLIGAKFSTDVALRQVPELERAIVANIGYPDYSVDLTQNEPASSRRANVEMSLP
jgi:hypothetical protein